MQKLFKDGNYSREEIINYLRKFGTHKSFCENARILLQKIAYPIVWGDLVNLTPSHFYSMELRTTIREVCCVVRSNSSYLNGLPTLEYLQRICKSFKKSKEATSSILVMQTLRGSPLSTIFGTWEKSYYAKFVLVGTT